MATTEPLPSLALRELEVLRSALGTTHGAIDATLVDLGPARIDPVRSGPATGAFVVDTTPRRLGDQPVTPSYLATAAEGSARFAVVDVVAWEGNQLLAEVELTVDELALLASHDRRSLRLFATARTNGSTPALHERLASPVELGLGRVMLERIAGEPPAGPADPAALGVIVGSPARRLPLLVRAIEQLVDAGRSLLVVSPDPGALDRLVLAADRTLGGRPAGTMLRVGTPSTRRVGGQPRLTANGLAAARAPDLVRRLHELASELRGLLTDRTAAGHERNGNGQSQPPAAARPPVDRPASEPNGAASPELLRELEAARRVLREADAAVTEAARAAGSASARHAEARQAVRALDRARTVQHQVDQLVRRVEEAAVDVAASASGVGRLAASDEPGRQLLVAAEVATARLDRRDLALAELQRALGEADRLAARRVDVAEADRRAAAARAAHAAAERVALRARADQARAAQLVGELTRRLAGSGPGGAPARAGTPVPQAEGGRVAVVGRPGDAAVVTSARRVGPAVPTATQIEHVLARRAADPAFAVRLTALRQEYRRIRREVQQRAAEAPGTVGVVLTTLEELVGNPAVYDRRYDNVVVERADLAPPASVLWAATRAERALTLAAQLGEQPTTSATLPDAAADRWLGGSVLDLLGLGTTEAVRRYPAGMVLD